MDLSLRQNRLDVPDEHGLVVLHRDPELQDVHVHARCRTTNHIIYICLGLRTSLGTGRDLQKLPRFRFEAGSPLTDQSGLDSLMTYGAKCATSSDVYVFYFFFFFF